MGTRPCIALVTQPTRLEGLVERWSTKSAAKFRFKKFRAHEKDLRERESIDTLLLAAIDQEAGFSQYEEEDEAYKSIVRRLRNELAGNNPVMVVEKEHLPNFMFSMAVAVVVIGQDGLVANTAKYAEGLPIIGVNPDPSRNDGVLLPFAVDEARHALNRTLNGRVKTQSVTMAEARLNDSQSLLAFNDLFIGQRGHASARYTLRCGGDAEVQSSSGVLVSTGAGSTGWMSSVLNMTESIAENCGSHFSRPGVMRRDERRLAWVVREPFCSKHCSASMVYGGLLEHEELVVESLMPENGQIFSDGIESDFLEFNSGSIARIRVSSQKAQLVVK